MEEEIWKTVEAYPNYEVSNLGRIRRKYATADRRFPAGYIFKLQRGKSGYPMVHLRRDDYLGPVMVHKTVCIAFHGPKPGPEYEAAHQDGNIKNCRVDNLEWKTQKENAADTIRLKSRKGSRNGRARINEIEVYEIKHLLQHGIQQRVIAELYSISQSTVAAISNGANWAYIKI